MGERSLKIAHVVDSLEVGGAEMLVSALCRLHRLSGHKPSVHCLFERGPLAASLEEQGIEVWVHGRRSTWGLAGSLYRELRRQLPDVVHCHNVTATKVGAPAARMARAAAIISTRHGMLLPPYSIRRELTYWLAARCCDRVVAVCDAVHKSLAAGCAAIPERIVTLRNGAAPASSGPPGVPAAAREGFTLVTVARLARCKDQATLLRATALASRQVPDLRLWIVGDGPEAGPLRALATQLGLDARVTFLGERHDVGRWLAAADLFVLSSLTEGLPVSLLEAMAAGLAAVVTNTGGMPEIVSLSGAGTLAPPAQPARLADAIVQYAARRNALPEIGARARKCYEQNFTPERMADGYIELYEECLMARGRPGQPGNGCGQAEKRRASAFYA